MSYPGKGKADYWAPGDHNAVCFECGRKFKASTMVRHWQGYYLCKQHWNPRQPQDFVRAIPDVQTPPWVQPMPADVFVFICDPVTSQGSSDYGVADCARSDINYGYTSMNNV